MKNLLQKFKNQMTPEEAEEFIVESLSELLVQQIRNEYAMENSNEDQVKHPAKTLQ